MATLSAHTTAPEPNSGRLTSFKSTRFDSPANNVGSPPPAGAKRCRQRNLQAMVDQIDPAVMKAKASTTGDALIEAATRENMHQSAMDVLAHSEVLRRAKEQGKLTVIEAEYQLDTGEVIRLDKTTPQKTTWPSANFRAVPERGRTTSNTSVIRGQFAPSGFGSQIKSVYFG